MNPYKLLIAIISYFTITALVGSVLGNIINNQFGIAPIGTLIGLIISYVASWVGIYIYLKRRKQI